MFDTPADARLHLAEGFSAPQVEMIVEALEPAFVFQPLRDARVALGGTRIGGTPDLPPGLAWPRRAIPPDAEAIADRGSPDAGEEMREHFRRELPYAFFAQVDLGEVRALGGPAEALPATGRLLFFYDLVSGPYDTGTSADRVIWDQSPRETLTAQAVPVPLAEAATAYRAEIAKINAKYKLPPPQPDGGTPYGGPARPMALHATLRPASPSSLDMEARPALKAAYAEPSVNFREAYDDLFAQAFDAHYDAANAGRRNQLLGNSLPEQDDPRFDAEVVSRFHVQHLSREDWTVHRAEIEAAARGWRLLLQLDVGDVLQERGEGTVYFLIRTDDLAERRFDQVVAVYQQT